MFKGARRAWMITGAVLGLAMLAPTAASAGSFTVSGTCGLWTPYSNHWDAVVPAAVCPQLKLEHPLGPWTSASGYEGKWTFDAPAGTVISSFSMQTSLYGADGWQAAVIASNLGTVEGCPSSTCPGAYK